MRWFAALLVTVACVCANCSQSKHHDHFIPGRFLPILYGLGIGAQGVGSRVSSEEFRQRPFVDSAVSLRGGDHPERDGDRSGPLQSTNSLRRGAVQSRRYLEEHRRGQTWTQRSAGLPTNAEAVESLTVAANDTQVLYLMSAGVLYKSSDGAATWVVQGTLPRGRIALLPVTPVDGYLIARGGVTYRAADDGRTWNREVAFRWPPGRPTRTQSPPASPSTPQIQTSSSVACMWTRRPAWRGCRASIARETEAAPGRTSTPFIERSDAHPGGPARQLRPPQHAVPGRLRAQHRRRSYVCAPRQRASDRTGPAQSRRDLQRRSRVSKPGRGVNLHLFERDLPAHLSPTSRDHDRRSRVRAKHHGQHSLHAPKTSRSS